MIDALKTLFENNVVSEEIKRQIEEAWDVKVQTNKKEAIAELREEFAQKYEQDKTSIVEAVDTMLAERLTAEIAEFAEDRKQLSVAKAKYATAIREHAKLMKEFVASQLKQEIKEFHTDKKAMKEQFNKLEDFVVESLSSEITEFYEDKKDLAETKVKLISEAKKELQKVKSNFVKHSAITVSETVSNILKKEINQLKEDIETSRKHDFGRKIFEAFAAEYGNSYLNEKSETAKLMKVLSIKDKQLSEAKVFAAKAKKLAEANDLKAKQLTESFKREQTIHGLISPLNKKQQEIMKDLLESVQTDRLQKSFEKYLPSVINNTVPAKKKNVLSESKEITGNKTAKTMTYQKADDSNVLELRRLAGLK